MPTLVLFDELAQLGHFTAVEDGVSTLRGYGVQLWLLVQDLAQLKGVYPSWETFVSNCVVQAFGTQDVNTAQYLSTAIDSETITVTSKSSSSSVGNASSSTSEHAHGRPLLTPDEIRRLPPSEVLVLEQGIPPVRLDRLDYRSDAESAKLWDENPMHTNRGDT